MFPGETGRLQGDGAGRCRTLADGGRGLGECGGTKGWAVQGSAEFVALANQLLNTVGQTGSAVLNLRPECVAPEGILADSGLQGGQPAIKAGAGPCEEGRHSDETDSGFGVQDMQDDTGRAPRGQVPIVLFSQDTREPGKGTAGLALEGSLGLSALLARQRAGSDSLGLVIDQEEGDEEGVDDVAMEAEGLLLGGAARVTVGSAEAGPFHTTILAT